MKIHCPSRWLAPVAIALSLLLSPQIGSAQMLKLPADASTEVVVSSPPSILFTPEQETALQVLSEPEAGFGYSCDYCDKVNPDAQGNCAAGYTKIGNRFAGFWCVKWTQTGQTCHSPLNGYCSTSACNPNNSAAPGSSGGWCQAGK